MLYSEWDTTGQLPTQIYYPQNRILNISLADTQYTLSYNVLFDALNFTNIVWVKQPVMRWKVDVTDQTDTTFSSSFSDINVTYLYTLNSQENSLIPTEYALFQNYPNPFNPTTRINYDLPEASIVRLTIYNLLGQEVVSLQNGWQDPGRHSLIWNSHNNEKGVFGSGVYFYVFETEEFKKTRKMMLLK